MVALRSGFGRAQQDAETPPAPARPNPADWLTLQQAACELNISITTARRMVRKGTLRNRIVPRRGGFAYLVYLPNSRHAGGPGMHACAPGDANAPRDLAAYRHTRTRPAPATDEQVRRLEQQVEHLSEALSRALRLKQRALPQGMGQADVNPHDPYERYRWLVRRRRWWPF
jgi:hypothetical protein